MVTGRDIEVLKARREQLMNEAARQRQLTELSASQPAQGHILAALGAQLVSLGYALQFRFNTESDQSLSDRLPVERFITAECTEGC